MQEMEHNAYTDAVVITQGQRNDTLYRLGCALPGQHGKDDSDIAAVLLEYNERKCDRPPRSIRGPCNRGQRVPAPCRAKQ
jgi:hypothetical protein